jgi:hypothetical protein
MPCILTMWQILFFALPPQIKEPIEPKTKRVKYYDRPCHVTPPKHIKKSKIY